MVDVKRAMEAWIAEALPFWAVQGVDHEFGGFHEELDFEGRPTAYRFKRVRVICRQIYVFAQGATLGLADGAYLSQSGCEFLRRYARTEHAWASVLAPNGDVLDGRPNLYDLAFVMFAMAWRYKLDADPEALADLRETLSFIQTHMAGPEGGYWSLLPASDLRQQNPHMHLLEACHTAFAATGDQMFWEEAERLVALFETRLFDGRTLGEGFNAHWSRLSADDEVEPGHHFEWAWILANHRRLGGADLTPAIVALVEFAERHGVDRRSNAVYDAVSPAGIPRRPTSRAWPNTERIKAWVAMEAVTGTPSQARVAESATLLLDRYCAGKPVGLWCDQFDAQGAPLSTVTPASTLYHFLLAFSEALTERA